MDWMVERLKEQSTRKGIIQMLTAVLAMVYVVIGQQELSSEKLEAVKAGLETLLVSVPVILASGHALNGLWNILRNETKEKVNNDNQAVKS